MNPPRHVDRCRARALVACVTLVSANFLALHGSTGASNAFAQTDSPVPAGTPSSPPPATSQDTATASASTSASPLTLEQAMRLAEERHYPTRVASENAEAAEARVSQAKGNALPRLELDAQRVWFSESVNKLTGVAPQYPEGVFTGGIQVSQPLIGLAPLFLQVRAASMQASVSRNIASTSKLDARIAGAQAFLNAQKAGQLVSVAQASLAVSEKQARESQAQLRAGRLAQADAMRFELSLQSARQQLSQAKITQDIALTALRETLATPETLYRIEAPATSFFETRKPELPPLPTALGDAEKRRTEARNAESAVKISEYYKLASDLDYLPSLNAFARYERDFNAKAIQFPGPPAPAAARRDYSKSDIQDKFSYGLQLKWNIWDWGSRWNRSSEYAANLRSARIQQEQAESGIRVDVTQSLLTLRAAMEALETSKASVRLAEEVYRLQKARFEAGQSTTTDVLGAERDQTQARGQLVNVRGDLDFAWLKFQRALGDRPEEGSK